MNNYHPLNKIPANVIAMDSSGTCLAASDAFKAWLGHNNILGRNISDLVDDDLFLTLKEPFISAIKGNYSECTINYPSQSEFQYRVLLNPEVNGCVAAIVPLEVQNTALNDDKYQKILGVTLDAIDQGIAIYDEHLKLVKINAQYAKMEIFPPELNKPGIKLQDAYRRIAELGVFGPGNPELIAQQHIDVIRTRRMIAVEDLYPPTGKVIQVHRYYLAGGGICAVFTDVTKQRNTEKELIYQANHDYLTEIPNRQFVINHLNESIQAHKDGDKFFVLFLDLDKFKQINDTHGHKVGDILLYTCAKRIKKFINECEGDVISRLGGDEFLLVIRNEAASLNILRFSQAIIDSISEPYLVSDCQIYISASIGICVYPHDAITALDLIARSDMAMFEAKSRGIGTVCLYDEQLGLSLIRRTNITNEMRTDLINKTGFYLMFQPIIDLQSKQIIACEALVRWHNQKLGNLFPDEFIPIAEETGQIPALGAMVNEKAFSALARMQKINPRFRMAINASPLQVSEESFYDQLLHTLTRHKILPATVTVEITESGMMEDNDVIFNNLFKIRKLGCELAIDDFGTGFSSLSYVRKYPFTYIKIDRYFVQKIIENKDHRSLIDAIVKMAGALSLKVVAEGIEDQDQSNYMQKINCDFGQGYLYGKPLEEETLSVSLADRVAKQNLKNLVYPLKVI